MLLEDLFNKKNLYSYAPSVVPLYKPDILTMPPDSSQYFNYLYSSNIVIPDKEFYLHWNNYLVPNYPDTVKLKVINDPLMKNKYSWTVGVDFLEVNLDTTKVKLSVVYASSNNILKKECKFSYLFDEKNCKWNVLDSTIEFY